MNWKDMSFGKKIAVGFATLILITVIVGSLGAWWMKSAQVDSEMLAMEYVPEMAIGAEIRGAANRLMYQMRGYGQYHFVLKLALNGDYALSEHEVLTAS